MKFHVGQRLVCVTNIDRYGSKHVYVVGEQYVVTAVQANDFIYVTGKLSDQRNNVGSTADYMRRFMRQADEATEEAQL